MNWQEHEALIRLGFFAGVLGLMALGEALAPRRRLTVNKPLRWASNLALVGLNTIAVRILFPLGAVGVALAAESSGWG
jgi:H+/Cl- antiporter ClcA